LSRSARGRARQGAARAPENTSGRGLKLLAVALLSVLVPLSAASASSSTSDFIATFWCGPPLDLFDDRRAAEIAAAGFNVVGFPCEGGYDRDRNRRALDVAARHGLGMLVADHRFGPAALRAGGDWRPGLRDAVRDYAGHPALRGYFVADEPVVAEFADVAAMVAEIRVVDPTGVAYVNLLPDYIPPDKLGAESYERYVERFVEEVEPRLLSYDYYPFGKEKDRSTFFANLGVIRWVARRHRIPFLLIALAMPHGPYRDPTEAELAWQVFHALAFGARGVSYFTYWTPPTGGEWNNRYGLVEGGKRTLHYHQVSRINAKARALAAELAGFDSYAVADSTGETGLSFPVGPIAAADGGTFTAGLFRDETGTVAALIVNRDYRYGARAAFTLRAGAEPPEVFDDAVGRWRAAADLSFLLPPGDAVLLRWKER
jgi:hypothetical protein